MLRLVSKLVSGEPPGTPSVVLSPKLGPTLRISPTLLKALFSRKGYELHDPTGLLGMATQVVPIACERSSILEPNEYRVEGSNGKTIGYIRWVFREDYSGGNYMTVPS